MSLPTAAAHRCQPAAHTRSLPSGVRPHGLFSGLLSLPEPGGADGAPAQLGFGSSVAPQLPGQQPALCSLQTPAPAGCWLGVVGVLAGKASPGCRDCPAKGKSLHQPFPPFPHALSSWQNTAAERTSTCSSPCCTCGAHRSPRERRPSGSLVSHNPPGVPSCPTAAWPQPRLLHRQQESAPWLWSPDYLMQGQGAHGAYCHPLPPLPLGVTLGEGPGLSPAKGRGACGPAGRAGAGELCHWGQRWAVCS